MLKFQSEGFQSNVLGTCMITLVVANPNALGRMNGLWDTFIHDRTCVNERAIGYIHSWLNMCRLKGYGIHSFIVECVSTWRAFESLEKEHASHMVAPNCREFKNANSKQPNLCPKDSNVRPIWTPDPKMTLNDFLWQNLGVIILVLIDWLSHFSVIC